MLNKGAYCEVGADYVSDDPNVAVVDEVVNKLLHEVAEKVLKEE